MLPYGVSPTLSLESREVSRFSDKRKSYNIPLFEVKLSIIFSFNTTMEPTVPVDETGMFTAQSVDISTHSVRLLSARTISVAVQAI